MRQPINPPCLHEKLAKILSENIDFAKLNILSLWFVDHYLSVPSSLLVSAILLSSGIDKFSGAFNRQREKEKAQKRKEKRKEKYRKRKSEEKKHLIKETEWRGAEESEQLEKSDLTEESKQPAKVEGFHYSSDSTQTSSKRKKHGTDTNIADNHANGPCIRLSLRKHKDPESPSNGLPCSSSRDDARAQEPETAHEQCACDSDFLGKEAAAFRDLIYNWKPPALSMFEKLEFDNQEWLFERKQQCRQDTRNRKLHNCSIATIKNSLWPRACHLSTLDVFALPYTVPY